MNMKTEKIKVFAKVGLMKEGRWLKGIILEEYENIFIVETYGNKLSIEKNLVKPVREMIHDNETGRYPGLDNFVEDNWSDLKNYILESIKFFFPEVKIKLNEEDKIIECEEFGVSVTSSIKEIETISCFMEKPVWEVSSFHTIPATRYEPEDISESVVYSESSTVGAAKAFLDFIWSVKSQGYWESKF